VDEADAELSGDVPGGEDRLDALFAQGPGGVDPDRFRPRVIRELQGSVEHSQDPHVIDIGSPADREIAALVLDAGASDSAGKLDRHLRARGEELDRVQDLHVAGAAAEVRSEKPRRLVTREARPSRIEKRLGAHHDSRSAEAALKGALRGEGARVALELRRFDPLECLDRLPLDRSERLGAAGDRSSFD
jgi:hypothetical protein